MTTDDLQKLGTHGYHQNPFFADPIYGAAIFSVRIFQWVVTRKGDKLKESTAKVCVVGAPKEADKVYQMADDIVKLLDDGLYTGCKNVYVK